MFTSGLSRIFWIFSFSKSGKRFANINLNIVRTQWKLACYFTCNWYCQLITTFVAKNEIFAHTDESEQ